ncbi:MipA/OmpV family protein [Camelimonas abortus]|uniref:MipA/OmpV family protein n=1 Tax=Camelimonas abortus TaxID=1017184 RepID=A0ABV7LGY4_9HYPH
MHALTRLFAAVTGTGAAFAMAGPALAQSAWDRNDVIFNNAPVSSDEWVVTVKASIGVSPAWPGADRLTLFGYPSVSYRHVGERPKFTAPTDSASLSLYDTSWLRAGVVAGYNGGRYSGQERRLRGLKDAGWSLQPGVFVDVWPADFLRLRAELRYAVGNAHGFVGMLGADFVQNVDRFTFAIGPRLKWGGSKYNHDVYGVRFQDALLTAGFVQPYKAGGGATAIGVTASASYAWSDAFTTTIYGAYDRLVGPAADSPIVRRYGSRNQYTAGVSAAYSFTTRALW